MMVDFALETEAARGNTTPCDAIFQACLLKRASGRS